MTFDPLTPNVWMVGGGIASMAAAAFLIRDAGVPGENIHILETLDVPGGSLDGAESPVQSGYVTRGGRMLEDEAYRCLWNLLETIPDRDDPGKSARQGIIDFNTNFWQMWRTTFAFQNWHSAIELRRYFIRFVQEFPRIHTLSGVRRTVYNQYDSIVVPLQKWMLANYVDVRFGATATDAYFADEGGHRRAVKLYYTEKGEGKELDLGENDHLFMTLGSITADSSYGGQTSVPELIRDRRDGGWAFWDTIAGKAPDFGRPSTFYGNIDENKWESFTLTMRGRTLLDRIIKYSGDEPGTGALMTWVDSGWLMSIVVPYQPHFPAMPEDTYTLWGYGLLVDDDGDYVKKKMSQATGEEILTELIGQLGFDDIAEEVLKSTEVTTVMMPYASAVFSRRIPADRPKVLPDRAANFAFLGQFTDLPEDVVFTVEYSVHGAMHAVYQLFGVDMEIPPIYHGLLDPKVGLKALESAFR